MDSSGLVLIMLVLGVGWWLFSFYLDSGRIRSDIEMRNGRLVNKSWNPFGKGWFGEKGERLYDVQYIDSDGNMHNAVCKTSIFTGVFWADDFVVGGSRKPSAIGTVEEENRRLRAEIEQLRRERRDEP